MADPYDQARITGVPVARAPQAVSEKTLGDLLAESQALRGDVQTAEKTRRRENRINLMLLFALVIFVALTVVVTWQNNRIAQQTAKTNALMADCTTPGGRCYNESKARTGAAVGDILKANVYMAECARLRPGDSGPVFDRFLEQCVADKLKTPAPTPSPQPPPAPTPTPGG